MEITVNGKAHEISEPLSLEALLRQLALPDAAGGIAVALNGELVRREQWGGKQVAPGDALEIVQATQGG
ncbi:MAG: sulfur carrier protein ThiS [SAR324 cluster bacterium]|nr:sulfur carrier protein ThiS [SAR324 cluster bacterium]